MDDDKIPGGRKHHSDAFHFAMASVATLGGAAGIPIQWPFGVPLGKSPQDSVLAEILQCDFADREFAQRADNTDQCILE